MRLIGKLIALKNCLYLFYISVDCVLLSKQNFGY